MVKEGYSIAGNDIGIGADVLVAAALEPDFAHASGKYFDNDLRQFAPPHPDAPDPAKTAAITRLIETAIASVA